MGQVSPPLTSPRQSSISHCAQHQPQHISKVILQSILPGGMSLSLSGLVNRISGLSNTPHLASSYLKATLATS